MTDSTVYSGKILKVDLTSKKVAEQVLDQGTMKKYVGGTGIGARILYNEVPPGVEWSDPENRLILATGPLSGTRMGGSGTFSVVTKGCLTNGGTATQANGYLGAYLRFNGLIGVVFHGASDHWVYLYIHDGEAELRDAQHLLGKSTWETEDAIKGELGYTQKQMSVFGIGPAGENLVKFACVIGDRGHAAAHNGCGAVMGSKRLKAIAVSRSKGSVAVHDKAKVSSLAKQITESILDNPEGWLRYQWGTSMGFPPMLATGQLPIKNMNTNLFPEYERFGGESYRKVFELTPSPCWACRTHHLHIMKITDGPHVGYVGEEPEYEAWAAWGPLVGVTDVSAAFILSNEADRLGMDTNEAGWLIAFVMDCYERGIITQSDTDGLEMTWGNGEAAQAMLHKIATRDGFGNVLAEGVKRAAEQIGGEALRRAVYIQKGHAPRGHDHRARWTEILDYATSNAGTIETGPISGLPPEFGLQPFTDTFSPDQVPYMVAKFKPVRQFVDCLGVCMMTIGPSFSRLVEIANAATGWDLTVDSAITAAMRNVNLLRAFNIRHGVGLAVEAPSILYSSVPVDGPAKGRDIKPHWNYMLDVYYQHMGWDRKSGKPLPETLRNLELEEEIRDLW
ncbi:aldehyde ferredoxin oxidoreductase family protein [Chloroflexota bacterium]